MNKTILLTPFILLISCISQDKEVERSTGNPKVIYEDLESIMPGQLELTKDYLLWTNPFSTENFVHIIDKRTGIEVGQVLSIGPGPEELVNPNIAAYFDNSFFAYDTNSKKQFNIQITEKGFSQNKVPFNYKESSTITRIIPLNNEQFLTFDPQENEPFSVIGEDESYSLGKLPHNGEINNKYSVFQGNVKYNSIKEVFVYAPFSFPYISIYEQNSGKFKLKKELLLSNDFQIIDGKLRCNKSKQNIWEIALTQDYIVSLQRDYATDNTDEQFVGRNLEKLPQTLFIYDYDLGLKRIINVGMPILRLTGNSANNTIYGIGLSSDFVIFELDI
ncbi:hypothetical protein M2480_001462 [Parabacteroides sp. PFB2-12]|uniref:hypothetical protein n=1 Tax=unclassified Parabacteroides TaxID=2649774 RepID=UPI0024734CEC|nr:MULTISPECIES: hypothetical protein [unclassified Parabacteroides]MDH6342883.1 hypothetical protein [Parabacteroides sp. PM6-13]MDH6390487.1 hypothetical protein [Parabacteroides sp. PFB2-12]